MTNGCIFLCCSTFQGPKIVLFGREFPDYGAYQVPEYFLSDWLNEVWDIREDVHDDYRFVYMGPAGTW